MIPKKTLIPLFMTGALLMSGVAWSGEFPDIICADCHTNTGGHPTEVSTADLVGSAHEGLACTDCHMGINSFPHEATLAAPHCQSCHADATEIYKQHGRGMVGVSESVPKCQDCHGSHNILPYIDSSSLVHPSNLPATCGTCHEDQEFLTRLNIKFKHPIEVYQSGVHGKATAGGKDTAASCNDCHSTGGTAHNILPPGSLESTINFFNISKTCGKCHSTIQREFEEGIHGEFVARGEVDAPTCTQCHGEHGILATDDPRSPVSPIRVAEATCTPCHDSAKLNEKYDLPTGRLQSYVDSYHGLKSRAGDKTVANCASCHGAHLVLPSSNPQSSVSEENLVATCGHCHSGMSAEKAFKTKIHEQASYRGGWPFYIKIIYQLLIFLVIGGMTLYCLLDYLRQVRNLLAKKQVRRMEADEVVQHTVLMISFTILVITGFSLRYYDAWWAKLIFGREGGAYIRGLIHRGAAIVMILGSLWHMGFLLTTKGKVFMRDISPKWLDAKQAWQMFMYNLGRTQEHPQMRRFSFVEKAEYWALVWGTVIMAITGLSLWFEKVLVNHVGKGLLEVFLVIHYYEAWLAFLAILVWHMYGVVFNPHVYPMNPSWLTGKMPQEMFEVEHPAATSPGNVDKVKRLGLEREV